MGIFSEIFSWWGGNTWGTRLTIAREGQMVGTDEFGNTYYEQRAKYVHRAPLGRPRRWVTYKDLADPSKVGADWHGWLHHTTDVLPAKENYRAKPWQKSHRANPTGTRHAYRPKGSILGSAERPRATGDYKPWQPD